MFEQQSIVAEREADLEAELQPLDSILQPLAAPPVAPQNPGFQLPRGVWAAMLSCYGVFFATVFFLLCYFFLREASFAVVKFGD